MRILFLCHSFNSLSQRLFVELRQRGHDVSVEFDINDAVAIEACEIECLPFAPLMDLARADVAWAGLVNELLLAYATRKELRERVDGSLEVI